MEFAGAEWRGRIDRPAPDNTWTVGDTNGNGIIDENETFGTRVSVAEALLEAPESASISLVPGFVRLSDPLNLMFGFIDVVDASGGAFQPDGLADDIDSDGGYGYDGFDMEDPGREPDLIFSPHPLGDFDDIVRLPTSVSFLGLDTRARYGGTQLMRVFTFESDPEFTLTAADESVEVGVGARFLSSWQDYRLAGSGGTLGNLQINSSLESDLLGPQMSVRWGVRRGRWRAHAEAAAAVTYMKLDGRQFSQVGEDLVPGQFNRPLFFSFPATANWELNEWDIAPVLEAGALATYDITPSAVGFIRCDAIQFGNVRAIENTVVYQLPSFGFRDPGGSDKTITSASVGVELRR